MYRFNICTFYITILEKKKKENLEIYYIYMYYVQHVRDCYIFANNRTGG